MPLFGQTWYVHGAGYYLRRAFGVILAVIGLTVASVAEYGLLDIASGFHSAAARWAWRLAWVALLVASLVRPVRALLSAERRRRSGQLLRPDLATGTRNGGPRSGAGLGALVNSGSVAAGAAFVLGVVLFFGWFVMFLIFTLQREYGVEHDARLRLQQRHLSGHDKVI